MHKRTYITFLLPVFLLAFHSPVKEVSTTFVNSYLPFYSDYNTDFTKAENLYKQFRNEFLDIKMVNKDEAEKIVMAICEAEEDERQTASKDASNRAKSDISSGYTSIKSLKDNTLTAINDALSSAKAAKSNSAEYSKNKRKIDDYLTKLEDYKEDLTTKWGSVEKMTAGIRGGNHPVVGWMMEAGQAAHEDRQQRSEFLASEVDAGSAGRIDCLSINGTEIIVVELKPCNEKAFAKAKTQLAKYIKELMNNWTSKYKKILTAKDSKFATVTKISGRCDCYTLCPAITDEGDFEKAYIKWTQSAFPVSGGTLK